LIELGSSLINNIEGVQWLCSIPLLTRKGAVGTINFARTDTDIFNAQDLSLLKQIAGQIAIAMDNSRAYREIAALTEKLSVEKLYLQDEIRSELNFEEIIGESRTLKQVLDQAKTVANSDATVLILGETGTGKELIARAIHRMSLRSDASFIKMNCAAIPTGLLESELFGHEKGAFTGAISQKIGRLELADKGTLFLDEIGDIALELQPKLLRALQDQEFERLGGIRTIGVNVRLIAATNQDLPKAIAEKHFRSDLFYRLNVFPIRIPPLREREDDIPLLVRYFTHKFAFRMGKIIDSIPSETMQVLCAWDWPGNVRELENFIERSVILTEGSVLRVPLAELTALVEESENGCTLHHLEREYIIRALRETGGVIAGNHGAAVRLGLKRTTLQSRIQRMGISREEYGS
jgi:formate hydrogenlyase transcriptional activator